MLELLDELKPDVLCLQETKCKQEQIPALELNAAGYSVCDHSGGQWNGVAILTPTAQPVQEFSVGLPNEPDPEQARWVQAKVNGITVASVYVINGKTIEHSDFQDKLHFFAAMRDHCKQIGQTSPVAILGDMNVCPTDLDVWAIEDFQGSTHTTTQERKGFQEILSEAKLVDAHLHANGSEEQAFTWWDYRAGSFHKNHGLRIDFALLDEATAKRITKVWVARDFRKGEKPSDHAPLVIDLAD